MFIKNIKKHFNDQKGMGLVEVIAAFTISIVVITSLVSLALTTMRSSLSSKLLLEGTKIATREIERVRALRDSSINWAQFIDDVDSSDGDGVDCTCDSSPCVKRCSMSLTPLSVSSGSTNETIDTQVVTRYFNITKDANDPNNIVRVSVFVTWDIGGQTKSTHVYTDLSNWQPK
jgi:hypothetical protein